MWPLPAFLCTALPAHPPAQLLWGSEMLPNSTPQGVALSTPQIPRQTPAQNPPPGFYPDHAESLKWPLWTWRICGEAAETMCPGRQQRVPTGSMDLGQQNANPMTVYPRPCPLLGRPHPDWLLFPKG